MVKFKGLKGALLMATAIVAIPVTASIASTTALHGTAEFTNGLVLTPSDMSFGRITYSAAPTSSADNVLLKTDGSITYNGGKFSAGVGGAAVAAGNVHLTGTSGLPVDLSCATTAVLSDGFTSTVQISNVKIADPGSVASGGVACGGVGTPVITYNLTTGDDIKIGGMIDGGVLTGTFAGGAYSTNNTGGTNIAVQVVYH